MEDNRIFKERVYIFCAMVKKEMELWCKALVPTLEHMASKVHSCSVLYSKFCGVKPVESDSIHIFKPFVFDRRNIPTHLWYWFESTYRNYIPDGLDMSKDNTLSMYYSIRDLFIARHRASKDCKAEDMKWASAKRRKLSKLVRDGEYNYTISAHSRSFKELFAKEDVEKAAVIFSNMFFNQAVEYADDSERQAALFLLGVRQGMHNAKSQTSGKSANVCGNSETFTNIKTETGGEKNMRDYMLALCYDLTPHEQELVLARVREIKKKRPAQTVTLMQDANNINTLSIS